MTNDPKSHVDGDFETVKHRVRKQEYYEALPQILNLGHTKEDLLHHFPAFVGELTLLRTLNLYDIYRNGGTFGMAGHIAEVGVYKGAGSLLFGKLIHLFEPHSLTMVHGFDHFEGTDASTDSALQVIGGNRADEVQLRQLIDLQALQDTVKIHNLDVTKHLDLFFETHPHLQFKIVFLDSGTYDVTAAAIRAFWPRLLPGGIMIFDQFNNEVAPGETRAVKELLPGLRIETCIPGWMPSAFVRKP